MDHQNDPIEYSREDVDLRDVISCVLYIQSMYSICLWQWSTELKQDSVLFGFQFGEAWFGSVLRKPNQITR